MLSVATAAESFAHEHAAGQEAATWQRRALSRIGGLLERESFVVLVVATYATLLVVNLNNAVGGDMWLLLAAGREIWENGLPTHDRFTIWAAGERWVDQQWAAQLGFYGLAAVGGEAAILLANVVILVATLSAALALARLRGASSRSVAVIGVLALLVALAHGGVRAQMLAYPLFVAVLWLLRDQTPNRKLVLIFPVLVLWANLHGSILVGAALVSLYGMCEAGRLLLGRRSDRGALLTAALVLGPWLCVLASPYAF